jgi:prefoldin subunit 5
MQDRDQAMREDAAGPLDCYRLWVVEYDLSVLEYDLTVIEYNRRMLDYEIGIVSDYIATVEQDIKDVQAAFDALKSAVARNTTGEPRPAYVQDDVDQAVSAAQEQINMSKAAIESAEQQASEYEKQATRLLQEAQDFVASLTCTG